jgi:hypothetical protein
MEKDTMEILDCIQKQTNPKLKMNFMINRCIRFTEYIIEQAEADPLFKIKLDEVFGMHSFKQFFIFGGGK